MKTYARIEDGHVVEIIEPMLDAEGNEIPIEQRFHPDFVATLTEVPAGAAISVGYTFDGTTFAAPDTSLSLPAAQAQTIAALSSAYTAAIALPVAYKSKGGVTQTYQADPGSISNLQSMLLAFGSTQTVPAGFYWVAADNTQVPFTYADLQGLAQVMGVQGAAAFMRLQTLKAAVNAAMTGAAVQAITWS